MAELTPVTLTPQEQAEFEQQQQPSGPAPLNPIRDLSAQELFDLATNDKEFDIASEFGRNPDLHADQSIVQKAADALHMVRQRGFEFSDLPSVPQVAKAGAGIVKGFGKQAWNYLTAGVNTAMALGADVVGAGGVSDALQSEAQRRVAENIAGSESAVTGLAEMAASGAGKIGRGLGVSKSLEAFTPEEKVKHLFDAAGKVEVQQDIAKGKGAFMTAAGGEVIKELESEGKPVRSEEVSELAAGDPFSWWTFGKVLGGTGKLVPGAVKTAAGRVGEAAGAAATVAGGRTLQAAGELTRLGARATQAAAPAVGMVKGALEAGPLGALAGLKGGEIVARTARGVGAAGQRIAQVGRDIATPGAVSTAGAQLGRDVLQSIPGVVGQTAHGLGMDIGLAAVTSESPAETQASVGIGATLGALGGARSAGQRILSGQLIAPRQWGANTPVRSSGQFPGLDAAHTVAYQSAPPAVRMRVNAIREFTNGAAPGTDVFLMRDSAAVERALTEAGVSPEQARQFGEQEGFFTVDLPTRDGSTRRAIIVRNVDAAPHESFHAIQDVLGEGANRQIDAIVQREFADRWEAEGQRYAERLTGQPTPNWRDAVNDASGWGHAEAMEKLSREAGNRIRNETGAEPDPSTVRAMVQGAWDSASRDGAGNPRDAWREILTPEEQAAVADRYIAREIAAENFDAIFKHTGPSLADSPGVLGTLSRVAGNLVTTLGGEPLAGRTSEFGRVPLNTPVVEAVRGAARSQRPTIEPGQPAAPGAPAPRPQGTPSDPAQEAQEIAANAPDVVPPGGTRSPRQLLTDIANAIGQRAGVRINYLSAPNEPAAATSSNRATRRAMIEAFRNMPPAARSLWEKTFFPERVIQRSSGTQIFGWAPEVFASNAHKLAQVLATDANLQRFSPYALDPATGSFTEQGWRDLFSDTQKFVQNQIAGQTGAGEPLVVPRETAQRGVFAPEPRPAAAEAIPQDRADFVSMLFNSRLPDTPRLSQGRPSLNIVGQEISAATRPGRVERPVVARAPFAGEEAARQGVEGREILEVNPLRNALTRELGDRMPSFVEANQRLNLENIREVQVTPEVPEFRGNTLTLAAGFQPRTEAGRKLVEEKGFEFRTSGPDRYGVRKFSLLDPARNNDEIAFVEIGEENPTTAHLEFIWTSPDYRKQGIGEALQREAGAFVRDEGYSKLTGTVVSPDALKIAKKVYPGTKTQVQRDSAGNALPIVLRESPISPESQFQPAADRARELLTMDDATWEAATKYQGKMGGGFTGWAYEIGAAVKTKEDLQALRETYSTLSEAARAAMSAKDMSTAMPLVAKAQAAREAYEAATGETLDGRSEATVPFMRRHLDPNYNPPMPGEAFKRWEESQGKTDEAPVEVQAQPKKAKDNFKFAKLGSGGFKKAWILPSGEPIQLGGTWHHQWLAENPEIAKKYGIKVPKFEGTDIEGVREEALKKGFVRVNFGVNNGTLTIEGRAKDWRKIKPAMEQLVERNLDDVYTVTVNLMDEKIQKVVDSETQRIFNYDDAEKLDHLPFTDRDPRTTGQFQPAKFEAKEFDSQLKEIQSGRAAGQTFNQDGTVWEADAPSDVVSLASVNVPRKNLNREQFEKAVAPYAELLKQPGIVAGVFSFDKEGKPTVSIDINAVVPKEFRDNTVAFAKANDQVSIWDAEKSEEVKTGGKGDTKLKDVPKIVAAAESLLAGKPVQFQPEQEGETIRRIQKQRIRGGGFFTNLMRKENERRQAARTVPTDEQVTDALSEDKKKFVGAHRELPEGEPIGVRIDIPAFVRHNTYVQTVHEKAESGRVGKRIGYDGIVTVDNPTFFSNETGAAQIKSGEKAKFPIATVEGSYNPSREVPADMTGWTEVGYNPKRHSYFYEKTTEEPVIGGEQAVSTGNSVFVKNAKFGDRKKFQFSAKAEVSPEGEKDLFGETPRKPILTGAQQNAMTRAQIAEYYPEAVLPTGKRDDLLKSQILESPLYKKFKNESDAVNAFGDKLVEFARKWENHPAYKDGINWYSEFVPMLKEYFGKDAPIVAELLAATSPQTSVNTNYRYALEAIDLMNSGKLDGITKKFEQGLSMIADNSWKDWLAKEIAAGKVPKPPKKPGAATFMAHWIETHNLKPLRNNGKLFGQHSVPVLQVLARNWLSDERGLKTQNFVKNILGTGHEATIDLWADRTMRRMGYEGLVDRWRILAANQGGVDDADFLFSQKAYRNAADKLGVEPDALQAALWFAEKQHWADEGWGRLDLGDFRKEILKTPQLRAESQAALDKSKKSDTMEGDLITPRKVKDGK